MKTVRRIVLVVIVIILAIIIIPLLRAGVECRYFIGGTPTPQMASVENRAVPAGLNNYNRSEEQTYLTLPEWYIVYSADEYAEFIANNPPSHFPYFQAISQYWRNYYDVCAVTRDKYPLNGRYHTILAVIGTSFTFENIIKGSYENTVGRITEWLSSDQLTEEDAFARQVAKEYGEFIHTIPWFEFPFGEKFSQLWRDTSLWGPNITRKWERKFALSLEYGGKALYARIIKGGNEASFTPQDLEIQVWATGISEEMLQQEPDIQIVKTIDDEAAIVAMPRYEAFTQTVPRLAEQDVQFIEIAGNDDILITIIAPSNWAYQIEAGEILSERRILSEPGFKRIAVNVPVPSLHVVLNELAAQNIELEHIYDY